MESIGFEKKLKKLFDYQRFAQNEKLAAIINEVEEKYGIGDSGPIRLGDDDLSYVSAAGDVYQKNDPKKIN